MKKESNKPVETKAMPYDAMLCTGLNDAAKSIHADAKRKGFWDSERETGTLLMLCVSELSEALEADREGRFANIPLYDKERVCSGDAASFKLHIKDTFEDELADTVIRLLDLCGARGIDLEYHINQKLKYNRSRERMHGKAY